MARGINKVILVGNLGADPETRYMPSGSAVTNLSVATSESWKDKQTGEQKDRTEWHKVVMFDRLAEISAEYLRKGSQVYIEGKLQTRKWQGQDGQDRYTTEVIVSEIQLLDSRNQAQGQFQPNAPQQNAQQQQSWGNAPQNAPQAPAQQAAPQMAPAYQQPAPANQAPEPSQKPAQQPKQEPAQYNEPPMDFDDDIPF